MKNRKAESGLEFLSGYALEIWVKPEYEQLFLELEEYARTRQLSRNMAMIKLIQKAIESGALQEV